MNLSTHGPDDLQALGERANPPAEHTRTGPARCFDADLAMLPGVHLPLRSMLIPTTHGNVLISPVGSVTEAASIGPGLAALVAPSLLHHKHFDEAIRRYQPESLWAPPGFAQKFPELPPVHVLGREPWPFEDEIETVLVEGAAARNEVVFFHKASKTIYSADLWFNIQQPAGLFSPLTFRLMGIYKRFATAKMWTRWVTDRSKFEASIDRIMAWDFERIIVAHGDIVETNARNQAAFALHERGLY